MLDGTSLLVSKLCFPLLVMKTPFIACLGIVLS